MFFTINLFLGFKVAIFTAHFFDFLSEQYSYQKIALFVLCSLLKSFSTRPCSSILPISSMHIKCSLLQLIPEIHSLVHELKFL